MVSTTDVVAATAGSTEAVTVELADGAGVAAGWPADDPGDAVQAVMVRAAAITNDSPAMRTFAAAAASQYFGAVLLLIT
ncbi:hypothetical protein [Paenarthrobacter aurescens]|uniref:hypothetical protein n=1 Tax=Paenarthrobacter aurescens TaxID=43663 RepID=UPI0021C13375|nr:hypothetical protein [Paenarthrobacter aurescens]MCT9867757.1 hypothetical protein [Paenarthrobacter aurescens]